MKKRDCVILDIITTGINQNKDKIIEIGAIKIIESQKAEKFESLVYSDQEINERITNLTKITPKMLGKAKKQEQVIKEFEEFAQNLPIVIFDPQKIIAKFMEKAYQESLGKSFDKEIIDAFALFKKELPLLKKYTLEELNKHYGKIVTQTHKSTEDCDLIYECLKHYADLYLKKTYWNNDII